MTKQYAHAGGIMILTPQGKVSRYFYGIEYAPTLTLRRNRRLGGQGRIDRRPDHSLLLYVRPERGTYGLVVMRVLRIFAGLTLVTLLALFLYLRRKEKQKAARWKAQDLAGNT